MPRMNPYFEGSAPTYASGAHLVQSVREESLAEQPSVNPDLRQLQEVLHSAPGTSGNVFNISMPVTRISGDMYEYSGNVTNNNGAEAAILQSVLDQQATMARQVNSIDQRTRTILQVQTESRQTNKGFLHTFLLLLLFHAVTGFAVILRKPSWERSSKRDWHKTGSRKERKHVFTVS